MAEEIQREIGKVAEDIEKVTGEVAEEIGKESGEMAGDVEKASGEMAGDIVKESGEMAADLVKESGEMAADLVKASGEMAADLVKESGEMAGDVEKASGEMAADLVKESGEMAGDVEKASGEMAGDVEKASGEIAEDIVKESGETAEDIVKESGEMAEDIVEESGEMAEDIVKESGEMAEDIVKESGEVAGDAEKESGEKAGDIEKESAERGGDIDGAKDLEPLLSRLPVKSLVRFQYVKKSWSRVIKYPEFIFTHLETFNKINMDGDRFCLLFKRNRRVRDDPLCLMTKDLVSRLYFYPDARRTPQNRLDLTNISNPEIDAFNLYGPWNGIYYLRSDLRFLINFSMREFRRIPEVPFHPLSQDRFVVCHDGFGFDPRTNDWKMVCIQKWQTEAEPGLSVTVFWRAHVYALTCGRWRNIDCSLLSNIHISCEPLSDTFLKGASHWWAFDRQLNKLVVAFNMLDEKFRIIKFREEVKCSPHFAGNVTRFKKSLAVIICPENVTEKQFDVWVLRNYNDDESWRKLLTIGPIAGVKWPLSLWKNRWVFAGADGGLVLYDNETQEKKNLGFGGVGQMMIAAVYMEGLVSLRRYGDNREDAETFIDIVPEH